MKPDRHHHSEHPARQRSAPLRTVRSFSGAEPEVAEEPLKCVWSGYPHYDRDCRSRIPASVVIKAWQREMQLKGTVEGFFNFAWRSGVWLAFGLKDGGVRGVYCPTHCSERDTRGVQVEDRRVNQPEGIALQ
jgi:hypothetical protein